MNTRTYLPLVGLVTLILLSLALAACGSIASAARPGSDDLRPIEVADVRVEIGIGSPIPVEVLVSGTWPDLCAQLALIDQSVTGSNIEIRLLASAVQPDCPPDFVGVPFRIALPLNGVELPHGTYDVVVNGVSTSLVWPPGN